MSNLIFRRTLVNALMFSVTGICAVATLSVLLFIVAYLIWNGGQALDWDFLTQLPKAPGENGGGMANAILGTSQIVFLASLVAIPIGILAGVYVSEFGGRIFSSLVRYTIDLLNGVPSIVLGVFAYSMIVLPMRRFSALAGALALSVILIPITIRNTEQSLRAVPRNLREGALALGATRWHMVATVIVPAAIRALLAGVLLGVGRIAGETTPLLFTSFNNRYWSTKWDQPAASLPVMIFTYAISPYEDWHRQAWAAGLLLVILVLAISVTTRWLLARGPSYR